MRLCISGLFPRATIKTMKGQGYGFRDQEFLKLKVLALQETRCALP